MRLIYIVIILSFGISIGHAQETEDQTTEDEMTAPESVQAAEEQPLETAQEVPGETGNEDFVPTEKISLDKPVAFPVDI